MKLAVINEVSASCRNQDILNALEGHPNLKVYNVGMKNPEEDVPITYIHTGIMAAILLNTKICDMAVGGCGTGQGFLNSAMQFPNVFCGLIQEPLDAWLFSQINGGNCISLALNKGYGWAAELNLQYIFEKLLKDPPGQGFPASRKQSQSQSREILRHLTKAAHKDFTDILKNLDKDILQVIAFRHSFMDLLHAYEEENMMVAEILLVLRNV